MKQVQAPKHIDFTIQLMTLVVAVVVFVVGVIAAAGFTARDSHAQEVSDFVVEVVVADPGNSQRSSAYWLALDRVLSRNVPEGVIDGPTRREILRDPSRYVQSYRYRKFDVALDGRRLSTREVREGAPADSVIAVTFPARLASIIQQQNQPVEIVEETVVAGSGSTLALIAVEQDGQQFLIGGERGKKFQSRMIQLGAANYLTFEFPLMDAQDKQILSPSNVLYNESEQLDQIREKYNSSSYLTGALVRLSADAWQSDWNLERAGQPPRSVNLTTQSLDEALITAITELTSSGNQSGPSYLTGGSGFQRSGVALRVENINSLAQYELALSLLQAIDPALITESLEPGATVFRATAMDSTTLQQRLARQPLFSPIAVDAVGAELSYRFQSR